jgi:hypothetical protein
LIVANGAHFLWDFNKIAIQAKNSCHELQFLFTEVETVRALPQIKSFGELNDI